MRALRRIQTQTQGGGERKVAVLVVLRRGRGRAEKGERDKRLASVKGLSSRPRSTEENFKLPATTAAGRPRPLVSPAMPSARRRVQ